LHNDLGKEAYDIVGTVPIPDAHWVFSTGLVSLVASSGNLLRLGTQH